MPHSYLYISQLTEQPRTKPAPVPSAAYKRTGVARAYPFTIRHESADFGELLDLHQRWQKETGAQLDVLVAWEDDGSAWFTGFAHPLRDRDPAEYERKVSSLVNATKSVLGEQQLTVDLKRDDFQNRQPNWPRLVWPVNLQYGADILRSMTEMREFGMRWQLKNHVERIEGIFEKYVLSLGSEDKRMQQVPDVPAYRLVVKIPRKLDTICSFAGTIAACLETPYFYLLTGARVELYERVQ